MKRELITLFITLSTWLGLSAQNPMDPIVNLEKKPYRAVLETTALKNSFLYLRINASDSSLGKRDFIPGVGIGYRKISGNGALDFFASYSRANRHGMRKEMITLPRIGYLYYVTPLKNHSFYAGPGVGLGRVRSFSTHLFQGLIASLSFGYELARKQNVLSFFQIDVMQPAVAMERSGSFPGPIAEVAFGAGF